MYIYALMLTLVAVSDVDTDIDAGEEASRGVTGAVSLTIFQLTLVPQINEPAKSADGFELSFATNTLGAFALTLLLEPVLKRSPPSRVIFVSSGGMLTGRATPHVPLTARARA